MSLDKNKGIDTIVNQKYIFIGPLSREGKFCIECYKSKLKELDLHEHYFGWPHDKNSEHESVIISELSKKMLAQEKESFVYEINRNTLEISAKSTYKRGDCVCEDNSRYPMPDEVTTAFNAKRTRTTDFSTVVKKIDKNKKTIYAGNTSIIGSVRRSADSYGVPMAETEVVHKNVSMLSYGREKTYGKSKYISLLESLERYATAFPYQKTKERIREGESDKIDLTLSEVIAMSDYNNSANYSKEEPICYELVKGLHNGQDVLIPEQLVYYNSQVISGEKRYIYDSSNGSAIGSNEDESSLHAMLELIERDAFLTTWYGQIPPTRIELFTLCSKKIQTYLDSLARKNIKANIFDISLEFSILTIWVLLEKLNPQENEIAFFTAAAASFDLEESIEKALIEATTAITIFSNVFSQPKYLKRKKILLENPKKVNRLEDHLLLYSNREVKNVFNFALNTDDTKPRKALEKIYETYQGTFSSNDSSN